MKFTSIVFLFISIILVFGGIFAMSYARNIAGDDVLIDGYSWSEDGQNTTSMPLDEEELMRITLTLSDCDIIIEEGAEESFVELTNFKPNAYLCTTSSKALTVSDDISITDYLSFDGSGVKFSGVWQTLYSAYMSRKLSTEDMRRSLVIHMKNTEELKQINLSLSNCTLSMHDISGNGDIKIDASKSNIELSNVTSAILSLDGKNTEYSLLNINANSFTSELGSGTIDVNGLTSKSIKIDVKEPTITLTKANFTTFNAKIKKGDLKLSTDYDMTNFARQLETKAGSIIIDGVNSGSSFSSDKDTKYPGSITIEIEEGNADVSYGSLVIVPDDSTAEEGENGQNSSNE